MHLAAIKSVLHALETIDLLSGQGGQTLLGTQRGLNIWREVLNPKVLFTHKNGKQFVPYPITLLSKIRHVKATGNTAD